MKVKVNQILDSQPTINKLLQTEMAPRPAFLLMRLAREIDTELKSFQKIRNDLIKKYGEELPDKSIKVKDENFKQFEAEINPLLQTEVDIKADLINLSDLEGIKITPIEINSIFVFLAE
jgi:hypothetical protein